jgi:hypothetical protein
MVEENPSGDCMLVSRTGLFWTSDEGECLVQDSEHESASVDELLRPYEGRMVYIVIRHFPEEPIQPDSWGGGCCRWEPSECPYWHHHHPTRIYKDASSGVVCREKKKRKGGACCADA